MVDQLTLILLFVNALSIGTFFILSFIHYLNSLHTNFHVSIYPLVSVIIPAHNESQTIVNCCQSILNTHYPILEIIVIDDGSTDDTYPVIRQFTRTTKAIRVLHQPQSGKASALNQGIKHSRGDIIVTVDADSIIASDAIEKLVARFQDTRIGAVGGNVKVANQHHFLSLHQAAEYVTGLNIHRRAFSLLESLQIIPGAIGAFRKTALTQVGGYSTDTKVEDMDLTLAIQLAGFKAVYEPSVIAYTETPESFRSFFTQRHRWFLGAFRVLSKYRKLFFTSDGGKVINLGLLFILFNTLLQLVLSGLFIISLIRLLVTANYLGLLFFLGFISITQLILTIYSVLLDTDSISIILISPLQGLWYNQVVSAISLLALISFLKKDAEQHINIDRLGKNSLHLLPIRV